jgi:hypothetical protein
MEPKRSEAILFLSAGEPLDTGCGIGTILVDSISRSMKTKVPQNA